VPVYTQYSLNDFVINPALAGVHDYYQIRLSHRSQWVGVKDAPRTYILSAYGPHASRPMGWGGYVYSDATGPTAKTGLYGAYGYNLTIQSDVNISFGLSLGLIQYKVDLSKIDFLEDETSAAKYKNNFIRPDAGIGTYLYSSRYYAGFSVDQLFNSKIVLDRDSSDKTDGSYSRLKSHFTLTGGYKFNINRDFDGEPSVLFRATTKALPQMEINAKATFRKMAWLALGFRTNDAILIMAGYNYQDQIMVGYSYDIAIGNKLNPKRYSGGSHEIMIGARFNRIRSGSMPKL
jgi:type IX secretion system PorP/SprF family membrane protein